MWSSKTLSYKVLGFVSAEGIFRKQQQKVQTREPLEKHRSSRIGTYISPRRDVAGELFEGQRRFRSSADNMGILIGWSGDTRDPDIGQPLKM